MSEVTKTDRDRNRRDALRRLYALPDRMKNRKKASKKRKPQTKARKTSSTTRHVPF